MNTTAPSTLTPFKALYTLADAQDLIAQTRVVDLLLDLFACALEPSVRLEVADSLARFSRRNLVTASEVRSCLALIDGADQVESAFAHLLLAS